MDFSKADEERALPLDRSSDASAFLVPEGGDAKSSPGTLCPERRHYEHVQRKKTRQAERGAIISRPWCVPVMGLGCSVLWFQHEDDDRTRAPWQDTLPSLPLLPALSKLLAMN